MRLFTLLLPLVLLSFAATADDQKPVRLMMDDGQILSRGLTVKVTADITPESNPRLILESDHFILNDGKFRTVTITAHSVTRWQSWSEKDGSGTPLTFTGTVIRFRADGLMPIEFYKPAIRAIPRLEWDAPNGSSPPNSATALDRVAIANASGLWLVTISSICGFCLFVALMAKATKVRLSPLFMEGDDWSLSRFQMVLWTLATGALVLALSLQKFDPPSIPDSLVVLMGLSLLTAGSAKIAGAYAGSKISTPDPTDKPKAPPDPSPKGFLAKQVVMILDDQNKLSLPRTQMLFWTVIMLVVFLTQSVAKGEIWEVPWQMVMLMGISQAGYVAAKSGETNS